LKINEKTTKKYAIIELRSEKANNINTSTLKGGKIMLAYSEIDDKELKAMCIETNLAGVLENNIKYVEVSGVQLYDDFIAAIEGLNKDLQEELPDKVINYYNKVMFDEEPEEEQKELNFESEEGREEFDIPDPVDVEDHDPITDPVVKVKAPPNPDPVINEQEGEKAELEEVPVRKIARLSTTPMTPRVEDSKLTINFKELDVKEVFDLPVVEDKEKLGVARKKAMAFARENGATKGQLCNISKILNQAGYYMR